MTRRSWLGLAMAAAVFLAAATGWAEDAPAVDAAAEEAPAGGAPEAEEAEAPPEALAVKIDLPFGTPDTIMVFRTPNLGAFMDGITELVASFDEGAGNEVREEFDAAKGFDKNKGAAVLLLDPAK